MSDCGVCIGGYDGDQAVFCDIRIVTARKPHKCCECGEAISPGQRYERIAGKWHEGIDVYKTCLPCEEIARAFACDGERTYTTLWEELADVFEHLNTSCFDRLSTTAAKQKLQRAWIEWKDLDAAPPIVPIAPLREST